MFQYQLEAEQLSENLTKLNNSLDPKSLNKMSNSEKVLQLEVQSSFYSPYHRDRMKDCKLMYIGNSSCTSLWEQTLKQPLLLFQIVI